MQMAEVQIVADAETWDRMRREPQFVELIRLARVANALSLAYPPIFLPHSDQSPRARRTRFAGLFYSAALLKEALHAARSLGKWFRDKPQYQEGIGAILSDPKMQVLESNIADKIRDELVFHFDRAAIAIGLERLPTGETVIGSFPDTGPEIGETHFDIADEAALAYLFGDVASSDEYVARIAQFMDDNTELLRRFLSGAHRLIAIGLLDYGCMKRRVEQLPSPEGDAT